MNNLQLTIKKDSSDPQKVEITLTENIHDVVMAALNKQWILPILQGVRKELPDSNIYYCFYLPIEDVDILKDCLLQAYTKVSGFNTPN